MRREAFEWEVSTRRAQEAREQRGAEALERGLSPPSQRADLSALTPRPQILLELMSLGSLNDVMGGGSSGNAESGSAYSMATRWQHGDVPFREKLGLAVSCVSAPPNAGRAPPKMAIMARVVAAWPRRRRRRVVVGRRNSVT